MSKPIGTTKERLRQALDESGMRQADLASRTKIPIASISQYLSGYSKPRADRIYKMASVLGVSEAWLLGYDVPKNPSHRTTNEIADIKVKKLPMLGEIACGKPIYCNEDRESYVSVGTDVQADFCLKCKGDSMIGARINDGDIVFVRRQDTVRNGEIAVVVIDDEATLKRFFYYPEKQLVNLVAENPMYPPIIYSGEELDHIRILGKAIAFQSDVE